MARSSNHSHRFQKIPMTLKLASNKIALHKKLVVSPQRETVSYWRLGPRVSGGNWFDIYRAAPKAMLENDAFDYVIKMVNRDLDGDDAQLALDRLSREAISTEILDHHGVIPLLDAEMDKAPFFLVQPWMPGGSLDRLLASSNDISLIQMLWIIRQTAEAINAAHDKNRVYLGLEPAHVLMGAGGRITLIGWSNSYGISQRIAPIPKRIQYVRYTAPECFDPGAIASPSCDVYSLGAFIHRLIVGSAPFKATNFEDMLEMHRHANPVDIIRHQPLCPARLNELVGRMLHKDPFSRPTISEAMEQLVSIEIENLENPAVISL